MKKIIQIAVKDFMQTMRSPLTLLWTLALPLLFTGFMGAIFGGIGSSPDVEIPIGITDLGADAELLYDLRGGLADAAPIEWMTFQDVDEMRRAVLDGKLAGGILLAAGADLDDLSAGEAPITLIADVTSSAGTAVEVNLRKAISRLAGANTAARVVVEVIADAHPYALEEARDTARANLQSAASQAWQTPLVTVTSQPADVSRTDLSSIGSSYDQTAPGMLVQFTINSLVGTAIVIVQEKRGKTLDRLLSRSLSNLQILAGHALYIFMLAFVQQSLLVIGGQFIFGVNYLRDPAGTWLIITAFSLWVTGLGLLIGVLAKNSEQVILYSLLAMFFFTALAGAWFPLEGTSPIFNRIGHLTPGAWAMDGLQNIIVRGLGFQSVLKPAGILALFALAFLGAALLAFRINWRRAG